MSQHLSAQVRLVNYGKGLRAPAGQTMILDGVTYRRHRNGGGWVPIDQDKKNAAKAYVASKAFIGPQVIIRPGVKIHGGAFFNGKFRGGVFHGGLFYGGFFYGGELHGGVFHDGVFIDDIFYGPGSFESHPDDSRTRVYYQARKIYRSDDDADVVDD